MFLLHPWSSPRRSLFFVLILAIFLLLISSCRSDPVSPADITGPSASALADGSAAGATADTPDDALLLPKDIIMSMVERTPGATYMEDLDGGRGSVKEPFDPDRGFVNITTTASGKLMGTVHLQGARPDSEFFVNVRVRYEDDTSDAYINVATITTNSQGNGNAHVQVRPMPADSDATLRRVAFRVRKSTPPNVLYLAVAWDVPLK